MSTHAIYRLFNLATPLVPLIFCLLLTSQTSAVTVHRLFGELDTYTPPGQPVDSIVGLGNLSTNATGAYAIRGRTFPAFNNTGFGMIYGRPDAVTADAILHEETDIPFGGQTYFREGFGFNPQHNAGGQLAYGADVAFSGAFGSPQFDSLWIDNTPIIVEGDAISGLPGQSFESISLTRLTDSGVLYYEASYGGNKRGLFSGTGVPLLKTGDIIGGTGDVVLDTDLGLGLGNTSVSTDGTNYITDTDVNPAIFPDPNPITDLVIINGNAAAFASDPAVYFKEDTVIPAADGGIGDLLEGLSNFDINNAGKWGGVGFTSDATFDDIVVVDGTIIAREGDMLPTEAGGTTTLAGQAKNIDINDDGDVAFIFGDSIFVNGIEYLAVGAAVDNGEVLSRIQSNLDITDRDANDIITVFFTGRDLVNSGAFADTAYSIELTLPANAIPGDLDGDGFVGIDDLNLVLSNWNQNVPPGNPLADPSGDGFVGIDDLNEVLGNWNAGTPPGTASNIPEPVSFGIFSVVLLTQVTSRGRNH